MRLFRTLAVCLALAAVQTWAGTGPSAPPAEPRYEMVTYYFCLLTRGPNAAQHSPEERQKIQDAHMANIRRLAAEGKLLVAGPFADNGDWRGIFIFKCGSLEEAQALAASDPAVAAGRLKAEIHPWLTAKGNIRDPEPPAGAATKP